MMTVGGEKWAGRVGWSGAYKYPEMEAVAVLTVELRHALPLLRDCPLMTCSYGPRMYI